MRASHFTFVIPYQPGTTQSQRISVLRRKWRAVQLVGEHDLVAERLGDRRLRSNALFLAALHSAVERR